MKIAEQIESYGVSGLTTEQLLGAIFTPQVAAGVMDRYKSLRDLEKATLKELCQLPGVAKPRAAQIKALLVLGRRLQGEPIQRGTKFSCAKQVWEAYAPTLGLLPAENFYALLLDARNRVMRDVHIARGTVFCCQVTAGDVFREAIREGAVKIIMIHNHPSGDPTPSSEDKELTHNVKQAGDLVGIQVLDHVVICEQGYISLAEQGFI